MRTPWLFLAACAGAPPAHTIDAVPSATIPPAPVSSAPSASRLASKPTFHDRFHRSPTYAAIHFEVTNNAAIPSDAGDALALIVTSLAKFPRSSVLVEGNSAASEKATLAVSRAKAVVDELVRRGVSSASLTAVDQEPVKESTVQFFERPGEQLSLDSGAFDACCRETQSMMPSVSWSSDMQRADSADGRAALIEERASCAACNGEFGPQGMFGSPGCKCRTKDDCSARFSVPCSAASPW